jgi:hypothetical protein
MSAGAEEEDLNASIAAHQLQLPSPTAAIEVPAAAAKEGSPILHPD